MINLAGDANCDETIRRELEGAGLTVGFESDIFRSGEVPSRLLVISHGWRFTRGWRYWVASLDTQAVGLSRDDVDWLHAEWGKVVRLSGDCACRGPETWLRGEEMMPVKRVSLYHIDTQEGLSAFVRLLHGEKTKNNKESER